MGHTRKAVALWNLREEKIRDKRQGVLQGRSGFSAKRTVTVQKWEGLYYIRAAVGQWWGWRWGTKVFMGDWSMRSF